MNRRDMIKAAGAMVAGLAVPLKWCARKTTESDYWEITVEYRLIDTQPGVTVARYESHCEPVPNTARIIEMTRKTGTVNGEWQCRGISAVKVKEMRASQYWVSGYADGYEPKWS